MSPVGSWPTGREISGVTVVVPYFDGPEHLKACLEAIRGQLLPHVVEIIVVDDASPRYPAAQLALGEDVQVISFTANRGEAVARNVGLAMATQSHVTFVDQDDLWGPVHLQLCAAASVVLAGAPCIAPSSVEIKERVLPRHVVAPPSRLDVSQVSEFQAIAGGVSNTVFAPKDLLIAFGGFPTGLRGVGDYLLLTRLAQGGVLARLNDPTYGYLRHEDMATNRYDMSRNVLVARLLLDQIERPSREVAWDVDLLSAFASSRPSVGGRMAVADALAVWRLRGLPRRTLFSIAKRVAVSRAHARRVR